MRPPDNERQRLEDARAQTAGAHWKRWGPYLSERAWGTVREDYSPDGSAWDYLTHDQARSKAYRWGEDGIAGICDDNQKLCFAVALWNGRDPILKERLFGLSGPEGNHGEDVKEYYFYLDSTPTHSYMKSLYKYPQAAFPYADLVQTNATRGRRAPEYELLDTGVFEGSRYWDVTVEYAKASPDDILIRITCANRGLDDATLDVLPTLWFRNTWSWGYDDRRGTLRAGGNTPPRPASDPPRDGEGGAVSDAAGFQDAPAPPPAPGGVARSAGVGAASILAHHHELGEWRLLCEDADGLLFTENETNTQKLYGAANKTPYVKDAFHEHLIHGDAGAVNPAQAGTKAAAHYRRTVPAGGEVTLRLRLTNGLSAEGRFGDGFDAVFAACIADADAFYGGLGSPELSADVRNVQRQAFAGLLWSKQFYRYDVTRWLQGDSTMPPPPPERLKGRNRDWRHVNCADVISMPDKWEYPWFAAWDLSFHCVPLAVVDAQFAKEQLLLLTHEWYQHPNGQLPAYEWAFGDVNPPVHSWATLRTFQIDRRVRGEADYLFLEKEFQKLLLTFTWWVNKKDLEGKNVFQGGFLGLDNIGVFDRSQPLPTGGYLEQSDGTSWMAMSCLNMLYIALELARHDRAYEDMAIKFFEHFVYIAHAMNNFGASDEDLWDETDGFYYDVLHRPDGTHEFLRVRSLVGLIPLLAVDALDEEFCAGLTDFQARMDWFVTHRPELVRNVADMCAPGHHGRRLLSIVDPDRLRVILSKMLDEDEFLSPHGIRSISRYHKDHPFVIRVGETEYRVDYEPAESTTGLFGGNSNWRGPIWFPLNYLLVEALQKFDYYLGPDFRVPFPTGSDNLLSLAQVAAELSRRLARTFLKDDQGRRPVYGGTEVFQADPHWRDLIQFFEYFHGDNGAGLGASHQTGWTGLVAKLIEQSGE